VKIESPQTVEPVAGQNAAATGLLVKGMTCGNCARHVTEAIQGVSGVRSATVSLENNNATVRWNPGAPANIPAVIEAIKNAGYEAKEIPADASGGASGGESKRKNWQWNLILGIAVTVLLMTGEWVFDLAMTPWFQWLSFALAGAVQVFAGAQFYRGAWNQLRIGSSNMDTLVALGSTTAFGYSAWVLLRDAGGELYFMEAAAIITLISIGHWIEARVSDKAGGALKSLMQLTPETARRISPHPDPLPKGEGTAIGHSRSSNDLPANPATGLQVRLDTILPLPTGEGRGEDGFDLRNVKFATSQSRLTPAATEEIEVPVSELKIGDFIILKPGDRVPVDGVVVEGDSAVDEAMLTGESIPADKKSGSDLFAGTVNLNGRLVMRVTATGETTALAHIIAAVQRAQTSRADIQRLGDRVSSVFVPIVVAIAIAAALWWGLAPASAAHVHDWLAQFLWHSHLPMGTGTALMIAAAVLIVACPCAMGLATPAAIMAGANAAARRGILIRDGVALEKAGKITAVIFDKTGTLTIGKPEVVKVWEVSSQQSAVSSWAAALARSSTHPISQAIAKISTEKIELSDWKEIRGSGVEANIEHRTSNIEHPMTKTRLGSLRWLKESGVDLAAGEKFIAEWSGQGATIVGLASEKDLLGLFAVRDAVKPNAANVVEQLRLQGFKTYLVTGDNSLTAASIAKQVGITAENVFAEVRPEQKAEFVKKLQAKGERVAFVGDGINDAPALTQADLGIAVSRASDVAREAADIILLKSEIEAAPEALGLARATLRTIKQNLFWAFFYNALGVPLAAMGFISPIFCAAAMGCSDLIVIGNALRLLRWRK
jgi:Cu+-exporting ATPase